jgi:hypothetical protein
VADASAAKPRITAPSGWRGRVLRRNAAGRLVPWISREVKTFLAAAAYFFGCFLAIMMLKMLLLTDYGLSFRSLTTAVIGALVTAKVVIVLDKVDARLLRRLPAAVDVALRTTLYSLATLVLLLAERAVEGRGAHDGLLASAEAVFAHRDAHSVWATAIGVGLAFLAYNAFAVLRREIGGKRVVAMFFARPASQ